MTNIPLPGLEGYLNQTSVGTAVHRPVHYLGSKLRLTPVISAIVEELNPRRGRVVDLFSGSGVVASALGQRQEVVAVDIQEYARVLASALLQPRQLSRASLESLVAPILADELGQQLVQAWQPLLVAEATAIHAAASGDSEPLAELLESLPLAAHRPDGFDAVPARFRSAFLDVSESLAASRLDSSADSVLSRYYGGLYFGIEQSTHLDVLASRAIGLTQAERDTAVTGVLSTASAAVGTVGKQFAQPLRPRTRDGLPKAALWRRVAKDRSLNVLDTFRQSIELLSGRPSAKAGSYAVRADYREFLGSFDQSVSVTYADPPYTRDHYSRFYHVLETISLHDEPSLSHSNLDRSRVSRGVYRTGRHQSPFSIVSEAPAAFDDLFALVRQHDSSLVLSYSPHLEHGASRPRVIDVERLTDMASEYFDRVRRVDVEGFAHSKLTRSDLHLSAPESAELLLVCSP